MKGAENCVDAKIIHITFKNDSLVLQFSKSKGQQNGKDHVGHWHVYAKPREPHPCPVLALARYLFTYPELLVHKNPLFQGKSQYNRHSRIFLLLIKENLGHLNTLGVKEGYLGMYSCIEGVYTMVATVCTVYPPIISICIRAGWFMDGVKDKYLKHKYSGDQYVGRCASGLNQLWKTCPDSPPYVYFSSIEYKVENPGKIKDQILCWCQATTEG